MINFYIIIGDSNLSSFRSIYFKILEKKPSLNVEVESTIYETNRVIIILFLTNSIEFLFTLFNK